jgi:hypothetical protein
MQESIFMPKSPMFYRAFGLIILIFILQACSCYGIRLDDYFPPASNSSPSNAALPSGMNCSNVRLSSPRTGLPNAVVTVYWEALAGAVNYQINLYSGGALLASWEAASPATSLQIDVSQSATGGNNPFELELKAFDADGSFCRDYVVQDREAAPPQALPATATPTCAEKPSASYC